MKKLFLLVLSAAMLFSCGQNKKFTIDGTIAGQDGNTIYLYKAVGSDFEKLDSMDVADGKFLFEGIVEKPELFVASFAKNINDRRERGAAKTSGGFLIEPGKLTIAIDSTDVVISGKENQMLYEFRQGLKNVAKPYEEEIKALQEAYGKDGVTVEEQEVLTSKYMEIFDAISELRIQEAEKFFNVNMVNALGQYNFPLYASLFSVEQQSKFLSMLDKEVIENNESLTGIAKFIEARENTAIGKPFADFTMPNVEGNDVSLSDYANKGKYVLIDFWASWCNPCIQEMPHLIKAYDKYKDRGFEIVGVSLDDKKDNWVGAIERFKMAWPQMSQLAGWKSTASELYGIKGIPHTVLLDKEGVIIAKDLRGSQLEEKLAELLGE